MATHCASRPGARARPALSSTLALAAVLLTWCGALASPQVAAAALAPRLATVHDIAASVASLQAGVQASPILSSAFKARYGRRLAGLAAQLPDIEGLEQQITRQTALLHTLDAERAVARTGLDRLQGQVRTDLQNLGNALDLNTAPVSVTAQSAGVTATASITRAHLDLQVQTEQLVLNVQASARVLAILALETRARVDVRHLSARLNALAGQVRLGVAAVMSDLTVLAHSDPSAAADARSGLAAGLASALATLSDTLTGAIDARQSTLRLGIARAQAQVTRLLGGAAVALAGLQRDVLVGEVAAAPLTVAQQQQLGARLGPVAGSLGNAATVSAQLASRLADLGALQDAQARIDREVQKARADLDGILAQADAALQGRLRSDVTVAISSTEQTIHVHLATLDVGALVRDLDFNVQLGLSVLQIAALHAEVTPSTHNYQGTSRTTINGVDMLLQVRLQGLQARIRTDVAAVRAEQERVSAAVRARVTALRSTLSNVLAPLVRRYQSDVTRLQTALARALAAANVGLHQTRAGLSALAHVEPLQGRVIAPAMAALRRAPRGNSPVAAWVEPGAWLPLAGYVWGWTVRNPRSGRSDARWYVLYNLGHERGYLYVPAALVAASPAP